ncbi:hypothetical protein AGMMS50233_10940 [Endomicrobiia bacterium]|nr:hypothetical protein AGMMS50233_10940 [Endomicrobiia bacterium]
MINKKPACKNHGFLDRPIRRTIAREVKALGRKRKVIMKLKTILSAFVLFVFVLGSCKGCPGTTREYEWSPHVRRALTAEAEAKAAQTKAESVALTDENAARYWYDARDAWLKVKRARNEFKNELLRMAKEAEAEAEWIDNGGRLIKRETDRSAMSYRLGAESRRKDAESEDEKVAKAEAKANEAEARAN